MNMRSAWFDADSLVLEFTVYLGIKKKKFSYFSNVHF